MLHLCKQFISGHFVENCTTLWRVVAKMGCHKLCAIFFWNINIIRAQVGNHIPYQ